MNTKIKDFWNTRSLGKNPGSDDYHIKNLELKALIKTIRSIENSHSNIADVGCGNGETLNKLCEVLNCAGFGIDYSKGMVDSANKFGGEMFVEDDISEDLQKDYLESSVVYTERCLINISPEKRKKALENIYKLVKPNGFYLMIESFIEPLNRINVIREKLNLYRIEPPWHNSFLKRDEIVKLATDSGFSLIGEYTFTSSYYFLSRVANAKLSNLFGRTPKYNDFLNNIGEHLPSVGDFGPVKMLIWEKGCLENN